MGSVRLHVRSALRILRHNPALSLLVIVTLGFGIGLNTALYSALDAVILRPPHYEDPERLVRIERVGADPTSIMPWTAETFEILADWSAPIMATAAYGTQKIALTGAGEPQQIEAEAVSPNYLDVLGVRPWVGAGFSGAAAHEVMLSQRLSGRIFGDTRDVLGRTLMVNGNPVSVVGVLPARFHGESGSADMLFPLGATPALTGRGDALAPFAMWLKLVGRVAPAVTTEGATARLAQLDAIRAANDEYPLAPPDGRLVAVSLADARLDPRIRSALFLASAAALVVLLIACMNVSSLLLARALQRNREIAIRKALGGSRTQLTAQLAAESIVLSLLGGVLAIVIALWTTDLLAALRPISTSPLWTQYSTTLDFASIRFDGVVLAVNFMIALAAGVLITLLPAVRADRTPLFDALRTADTGGQRGRQLRVRNAIVVAQIALAMTLLVSGGLLVRSLMLLHDTDVGFNPATVATMRFELPRSTYTTDAARHFYDELLQRTKNTPGVATAAIASSVPLTGITDGDLTLTCPATETTGTEQLDLNIVSPEFFNTLRVPLQSGRYLRADDAEGASIGIVINGAAAAHYWPNSNPIGQRACMRFPLSADLHVVGVVDDVQYGEVDAEIRPAVYIPSGAYSVRFAYLTFRTTAPPRDVMERVRQHVRELDPNLPVVESYTMQQRVTHATSRTRFGAAIISIFGIMAGLLATMGVYGVIAQTVTERRREIGIRIALGSARRDVLGSFLRRGLRLALLGLVAGAPLSLLAARALETQLYGIRALDPTTLFAVAALFTAVTLAAVALPAVRATRVDPLTSLREE